MEKQLFKQLSGLLIKLGFEPIVSEENLVVGSIDLCPDADEKHLSKGLNVHLALHDDNPMLYVTLGISTHEIRIFHSQLFESVRDLEKLLMNNNLIKHIIKHKTL